MIEEYLECMRRKGYSERTLTGTGRFLWRYAGYLWDVFGKKIIEATEDDLEKYILDLKSRKAPGTVRLELSRVRTFYRYLHQKGYLLQDPTLNLIVLKKENLPKTVPDHPVIESLLNRPDEHTYHGMRDRAILEVLYSSGLRNKEARDLTVQDVDLRNATLRVTCGKGGRGRTVPLGKKAIAAIARYLEITRPKYVRQSQENHLFLSERGNPLPDGAINEMLERYRSKSNLTKNISPHTLRHACALGMLRGGAPIESVQELLGHKQLTTTQIYTRLNPKDLKQVHRRFHPREKTYYDG